MDALLIGITVMSLVVALVMSVVAWRATHEARQRAAARVATLRAAADISPIAAPSERASGSTLVPPLEPAPASRPWRSAARSDEGQLLGQFSAEHAAPAGEVRLNSGFLATDEPVRQTGRHQRALAVAAGIFAILLGGFTIARVGAGDGDKSSTAGAPLELLSLRHEREGALLSVAGLVRNPASGDAVERVSAVVMLFDQQGTFVTSAKAPLDFVKLAAGEESPFVVKMQAPTSVARYRVSFRTEDGTLTHVDRRNDGPQSAPVALTGQ